MSRHSVCVDESKAGGETEPAIAVAMAGRDAEGTMRASARDREKKERGHSGFVRRLVSQARVPLSHHRHRFFGAGRSNWTRYLHVHTCVCVYVCVNTYTNVIHPGISSKCTFSSKHDVTSRKFRLLNNQSLQCSIYYVDTVVVFMTLLSSVCLFMWVLRI